MRVTVIGAGVAGLTAALALRERGAAVEILERSESLGTAACSRHAGGMLAPWCEAETAEPLVTRLGQEALSFWPRHVPTEQRGSLVVAAGRDLGELSRFARRTSDFEKLDGPGLAALEPDLEGRFQAALYFPREAHLAPRIALAAMAERLRADGVVIRFGVSAEPEAMKGEAVIDCRGLAARQSLPELRGVKGEMLVLHAPDIAITRPIRLLHPRWPVYVVPRGGGVYMIGATSIENSERGRVSARSAMELLSAAYALHPAFAEAEILEMGADARPAFPDNLPRLSRQGAGLAINGLYRHGFLLSPALARMAAAALLDGAEFPEVMR
ncbi:FAD-dependent oxidoreductase [Acetobacteraceae bacterium H6797]|nr:FAD-dependent oxidoreductase [Acetobacteraceae bacterium H6797]